VTFVQEQNGTSVFGGAINNLLWISYIVMLGLYSSAFASYATQLIHITGG